MFIKSCLLFIVIFTINANLVCLNGIKILTRQPSFKNKDNYKLIYRCFCPIDYEGDYCESKVKLLCYLSPTQQKINENNTELKLKFTSECFIGNNQTKILIPLGIFMATRNQKNNYGVNEQFDENTEIVWANKTYIFDKNGHLKNQNNINRTKDQEQAIINGDGPYQFQYKMFFLGYPLNSLMLYTPKIIRYHKGNIEFKNTTIDIQKSEDYLSSYKRQILTFDEQTNLSISNITVVEPVKKILPELQFILKINFSQHVEYEILRTEIMLSQIDNLNITHKVSINSANWQMTAVNFGLPQLKQTNKLSQFKIILLIILILIIISIIIYIIIYFKNSIIKLFYNKIKIRKQNQLIETGLYFKNQN